MPTGKVKYFDPDEGYGYIVVPKKDGHDEVYVDGANLKEPEALIAGQEVEFEMKDSSDGPEAVEVAPTERKGRPAPEADDPA